jgi:hypothetical protein
VGLLFFRPVSSPVPQRRATAPYTMPKASERGRAAKALLSTFGGCRESALRAYHADRELGRWRAISVELNPL